MKISHDANTKILINNEYITSYEYNHKILLQISKKSKKIYRTMLMKIYPMMLYTLRRSWEISSDANENYPGMPLKNNNEMWAIPFPPAVVLGSHETLTAVMRDESTANGIQTEALHLFLLSLLKHYTPARPLPDSLLLFSYKSEQPYPFVV